MKRVIIAILAWHSANNNIKNFEAFKFLGFSKAWQVRFATTMLDCFNGRNPFDYPDLILKLAFGMAQSKAWTNGFRQITRKPWVTDYEVAIVLKSLTDKEKRKLIAVAARRLQAAFRAVSCAKEMGYKGKLVVSVKSKSSRIYFESDNTSFQISRLLIKGIPLSYRSAGNLIRHYGSNEELEERQEEAEKRCPIESAILIASDPDTRSQDEATRLSNCF